MERFAQLRSDATGDFRRPVEIAQAHPHTLHLLRLPTQHLRRIGAVDHRQAAVQFGADLENTDQIQTLHPRRDATGRIAGFGHDQGQFVAQLQAETTRRHQPDDHSILAWLEVF